MAKVKKVRKSNDVISRYKLANGRELTKKQAVTMAERGRIDGVVVVYPKKGEPYIRSIPDNKEGNNFENLPRF